MKNELVSLKSVTTTVDEIGDTIQTVVWKEIFAEKKSIKQSEFYQAQSVGIKPEITFVIHPSEYENELEVKYNDKIYKVIRTYQTDNENLEIVVGG